MLTSNRRKPLASTGEKLWFYGVISYINLAILGMFVMVNVPPPTFAATPIVVHQAPPPLQKITMGLPTRVVLPSLAIDLPVQTGSYDQASNTWSTSTTDAYYADYSVPVNDHNGTTLIYSHARWGLFGTLPDIAAAAPVTIYTDTGYAFHYTYQSMRQVDPSDTSVFTVNGPPTLVLQTCAGDWSQYRALYSFRFVSVEKV